MKKTDLRRELIAQSSPANFKRRTISKRGKETRSLPVLPDLPGLCDLPGLSGLLKCPPRTLFRPLLRLT